MGTLTHPQKRADSAMRAIVENRRPKIAMADDWLARGWNPFKPQEGAGYGHVEAMQVMIASGGWQDWIVANEAALAPLARAAYKANPSGKLEAGAVLALAAQRCHDAYQKDGRVALDALLAIGIDPNSQASSTGGRGRFPAMFEATRAGAERIVAAGWDPAQKGPKGETCWEHWARRASNGFGSLRIEDLDWLAPTCPASWSGSESIGAWALHAHIPTGFTAVARRLADAGAPPSAFGVDQPGKLAQSLSMIVKDVDRAELARALGDVAGWGKFAEAFAGDLGAASPVRRAAYLGRAKTLGVAQAHCPELFDSAKAAALAWECSGDWAEAKARPGAAWERKPKPSAAGMVWLMGRVGVKDAELARQALARCVGSFPGEAANVALTCATKGLLAESGPHSAMELYQGGDLWEGYSSEDQEFDSSQGFSEFSALCEARLMKRAFKPKKAPAPPKRRL